MTETSQKYAKTDRNDSSQDRLSLNEKLALISLIDEGIRIGHNSAPLMTDLFNNLWDLVSTTVSGSKIDRSKPKDTRNGFSLFEINAESGENLGRLNMLYLKKPLPCYYLVYVEVAPPFRRKGLGNRILEHFRDFLNQKSAIGILDNIIPEEDITYHIYSKQSWEPIENFIGHGSDSYDNYMVWIPPRFQGKDLREPLLRLVHHLRRKRESIDMRENEEMVRRTISEFKELYSALLTYFEPEISRGSSSALMRFMFTRFTTKLIAFRRRIGDLIGYTGGGSMEQVIPLPEIAALPVQSYAPYEEAENTYSIAGDERLCTRLSELMEKHPSRIIESLPIYRRPSFVSWTEDRGFKEGDTLTIGDLLDLGFDPTRLKEISIDGEEYIFERIQTRQLPELDKKRRLLLALESKISGFVVNNARLMINPPLLTIQDRANAYILRRKIGGIHMDEALEQLQASPALKTLNRSLQINRLMVDTAGAAMDLISEKGHIQRESINELLTFFVSWDLKKNRPLIMIDFAGNSLEAIWIA